MDLSATQNVAAVRITDNMDLTPITTLQSNHSIQGYFRLVFFFPTSDHLYAYYHRQH